MGQLDERRASFEAKYQHDQELQFRVQTKASRKMGLWAAAEIGLEDDEAKVFAEQVVDADFDEPGFEDVIRFLEKEFAERRLEISDHRIRAALDQCVEAAKEEVMAG